MNQLNFSKISQTLELPDLLETQKRSFREFLQLDVPPKERAVRGIQASFEDVFPIESNDGSMVLEFVRYSLGEARYTVEDAMIADTTYAAPLKALLRLSSRQPSGKLKQIVEQEVVLCDLPLMTDNASFIINGAERVVVSQLHRSPGIIFEEDEENKISEYGKALYVARIIPYRGAWIEFEYDTKNVLHVRIDRKKKFPATTFLRACGVETDAELLQIFYSVEEAEINPKNPDPILRRIVAEDVISKASGEVLIEARQRVTLEAVKRLSQAGVKKLTLLSGDPEREDMTILETLKKDSQKTTTDAQYEIYKKLRGQEFIVPGQAEEYLDNLIFKNLRKYDLGFVGRYKINKKLGPLLSRVKDLSGFRFEFPNAKRRTLTVEDVVVTMQYLIMLNNGFAEFAYGDEAVRVEVDDIDHLGNRRVRGVGELLENQIRVGLAQMSRVIRERLSVQDKSLLTPRSLINTAPVVGIIRKFFGTSQLSQFMDQINPLAELTHKRRLSALGPGGLNRKRAGFEVRDVHYTHYGRICPIETPEGPNIGLITTMAAYSRINEYGLIESPYRRAKGGKLTGEVEYLTADLENEMIVAQANTPLAGKKIDADLASARNKGEFPLVEPKNVTAMDVSPLQVVGVSAACIPFLEHDDANRALMGANMQRQAVPLLITEPPLVGTGMEPSVVRDSGAVIQAKNRGTVIYASAALIVVNPDRGKDLEVYTLRKYQRSNQDTCIDYQPTVNAGQSVAKGEVLACGPATAKGQLALGRNVRVAFMSWEGYNYEDAVIVSSRIVKDDVFTSIHISEFEIEARDTKLGPEEITRDIPNVGAEALDHLDDTGIVIPSTVVGPGDILVGKVTPKGEQQMTPEERLLKVIFGKKAEDVQDASLRVPPGVTGQVIGVRTFVRREKLARGEERRKLEFIKRQLEHDLRALREERKEQLLAAKELPAAKRSKTKEEIEILYKLLEQRRKKEAQKEQERLRMGDSLPVTVNKVVKVFIASKRKLQVGDKVAGRHGNKGIIARIVPEADMPHQPDGTPIDIILSPLGIPSRMNVGQLYETMLGWAASVLGTQMLTPVFDGAKDREVTEQIRLAKKHLKSQGVPEKHLPDDDCRIQLIDGRTGEPFEEKATVGFMYMLKLNHLVEDKIHARSTGPYSLITRQPLGGKAQFGGQRFGEMEVWAIEGYGASYALQEFLTVKSDDVNGRTKMYEAIIKGEIPQNPGTPESFRVLVSELQALGLNVELFKSDKADGETAKTTGKKSKSAAKA